eukprot:8892507-Alexandrium_andersonii.AAC.1
MTKGRPARTRGTDGWLAQKKLAGPAACACAGWAGSSRPLLWRRSPLLARPPRGSGCRRAHRWLVF